MAEKQIQIDSGILQFTPKGAYYEESDEQFKAVYSMWKNLFHYDRTMFCLVTLLGGTRYSKGRMNHILLGNPQPVGDKALIPEGLSFDFEENVIMYNLNKETVPQALKNLLMLSGKDGKMSIKRVNNSRTKRIILKYIFDRDNKGLDYLAINYKGKLKKLVRHALGIQNTMRIINGDVELFMKLIGRYNRYALPVVCHLFDREVPLADKVIGYFPMVVNYWDLRNAAKLKDPDAFRAAMKGMPQRTVMGFRNTYKIPIPISEIYDKTQMSSKDKLQSQTAAKRSGAAKLAVNYKKQDIYDLFKIFYHKSMTGDLDDLEEILQAIDHQESKIDKIDLGSTVVILDSSKSMQGSDSRPLHPFLTGLSIVSVLDNVKRVFYAGGDERSVNITGQINIPVTVPAGATRLWSCLVDASELEPQTIVVISDGYENELKGMFQHTYKYLKDKGHPFSLIHLNPVFSAGAKQGSTRSLTDDTKPLPVENYKYLDTEIIFNQMIENSNVVKKLLISKYTKLIEGGTK